MSPPKFGLLEEIVRCKKRVQVRDSEEDRDRQGQAKKVRRQETGVSSPNIDEPISQAEIPGSKPGANLEGVTGGRWAENTSRGRSEMTKQKQTFNSIISKTKHLNKHQENRDIGVDTNYFIEKKIKGPINNYFKVRSLAESEGTRDHKRIPERRQDTRYPNSVDINTPEVTDEEVLLSDQVIRVNQ